MDYSVLSNLSRSSKRFILFTLDTALIPASLYLAFALRFGTGWPLVLVDRSWLLLPLLTVLGAGCIVYLRLHKIKLNALEARSIMRIGACAALLTVVAIVASYVFDFHAPRSVPVIFGALFFLGALLSRLALLALLGVLESRGRPSVPVAVYGAGSAGIQLVSALRRSREVRPVLFVDDNPSLWGLIVSGLAVARPDRLEAMAATGRIERVLLAMPSVPRTQLNALLTRLAKLNCEVQVLPSYVDLISGKNIAEGLRTVAPNELLERDAVDLDIPDVAKAYAGRVVMVTGAGGSIGSELCRRLLNCRPERIVLYEQSEIGLYEIDRELRPLAQDAGIGVSTRLGSVTNRARIEAVMAEERVEIVLHAAAYKHVPMVEENELEGARNNVLGTQFVAEAAQAAGVERFILISTDKAVRPTNIMGATKRMAELVIQDLQTRSSGTKFAMVRFGNVMGSSGSVLPLFQRQIARGGPLTVTHPEVTRFFMTIPEASRLVLLAGAYAEGGDVFVLDMGQPMKIIDVARRLIALSGHRAKEAGSEGGDIAIEITGLRPGEKLYEELLIDDASLRTTPHEKILRAQEARLSQIEVLSMLKELQEILNSGDAAALRRLISKRIEGYHVQKTVGYS
ncbi:polysaccharide biosynthesis protein [Brevirhabdus sp.]|uniref:polysaccharide biosynthesis protein n=1 Tax=Brevirhabdus sp. TaxID=2004514 RepID=UPI004059B774